MTLKSCVISAALLAMSATASVASTLTFSDTFFDTARFDIPQLSASVGTLTSIEFVYEGDTAALAREQVFGVGTVGSATAQASILVTLGPLRFEDIASEDVECTVQGGGDNPSCVATARATAVLSGNLTLSDPSDLALFSGDGVVDGSFIFEGSSSFGFYEVNYTFSDPVQTNVVPLPAGGALLLTGVLGFTVLKRKRNRQARSNAR